MPDAYGPSRRSAPKHYWLSNSEASGSAEEKATVCLSVPICAHDNARKFLVSAGYKPTMLILGNGAFTVVFRQRQKLTLDACKPRYRLVSLHAAYFVSYQSPTHRSSQPLCFCLRAPARDVTDRTFIFTKESLAVLQNDRTTFLEPLSFSTGAQCCSKKLCVNSNR